MYLYDYTHRLSILMHPKLKEVIEEKQNIDPYYLSKYKYLKSHSFFKEIPTEDFGEITESMIKESFRQTAQITFEVTDFCNLNCTYCSFGELYEGFDARNQKKLDLNSAIKIIDYVFDHKPRNKSKKILIGFYGGEPLCNANLVFKIVDYINKIKRKKNIIVEYSMTTNATLLDKYMDKLVKNNFDLLISLDGNRNNNSYRKYRDSNKNAFDTTVKNIDNLKNNYPEYFLDHVRFNSVLTNRNSVKEIHEFIYNRYGKVPRISQLALDDVKRDKSAILKEMFHDVIESENEFQNSKSDLFPIVHRELSMYKEVVNFLKYHSINYYISNIIELVYYDVKFLPTSTCLPGQKKILLTTNNKLLPCEKVNYKYLIGKIEDEVELDFSAITKKYQFYYKHVEKECSKCYLKRFCSQCMFHLRNLNNNENFSCEYFCGLDTFRDKLNRMYSFLEKYPEDFHAIIEDEVFL